MAGEGPQRAGRWPSRGSAGGAALVSQGSRRHARGGGQDGRAPANGLPEPGLDAAAGGQQCGGRPGTAAAGPGAGDAAAAGPLGRREGGAPGQVGAGGPEGGRRRGKGHPALASPPGGCGPGTQARGPCSASPPGPHPGSCLPPPRSRSQSPCWRRRDGPGAPGSRGPNAPPRPRYSSDIRGLGEHCSGRVCAIPSGSWPVPRRGAFRPQSNPAGVAAALR